MPLKKSRIWSEREIKYLRYNYNSSNRELLERVLGRSWRAIQSKAAELGLGTKRTRWTPQQIEYLKKYYNSRPKKILMRDLGKNWRSIKIQASRLGITCSSDVKEYAKYAVLKIKSRKGIERRFKIDLLDAYKVRKRKWYLQKTNNPGKYYAVSNIDGKIVKLARFLFGEVKSKKYRITYKNGDITDNRRKNLVLADNSTIQYKRTKANKNSKSKKRGVIYCRQLKKWRVEFKVNGKTKYFGLFKTKAGAEKVANAIRKKLIERRMGRNG